MKLKEDNSSQPKSIFCNSLWSFFSTICSMITLFFLTPFLIHNIGENEYGFYVLLTSVIGFLGVINLGLGEATLRYVAYYYSRHDHSGINRVLNATLFVYVAMGLLTSLLLFFCSNWISSLLNLSNIDISLAVSLLRITAVVFFIRFISGPFLAIPQAMLRYDITSQLAILEVFFRIIGSIGAISLGMGLYGLIIWNGGLALFILINSLIISKRLLPDLSLFSFPTLKGIKEIFSYGVFSFLSQVVGLVWRYTDRILLGILIGTNSIAYFSVPQELVMRFLGLASSVSSVLMPKFSSIKDDKTLCYVYLQSTSILLTFTLIIFIPIAVLVKDFLRLWVSPEFADQTAFVGTILSVSCMIRGAFIPYQELFKGIGKPQYLFVLTILSSTTILIANLILIPLYGLAGAGYAFCISPIWGIVTILFVYRRILKINSWGMFFKLVFQPLILGFVCLGISFWFRSLFSLKIEWGTFIFIAANIFVFVSVILLFYNMILGYKNSFIFLLISNIRIKFREFHYEYFKKNYR